MTVCIYDSRMISKLKQAKTENYLYEGCVVALPLCVYASLCVRACVDVYQAAATVIPPNAYSLLL